MKPLNIEKKRPVFWAIAMLFLLLLGMGGCKEKEVQSSSSQESSSEAEIEVDPNWPVSLGELVLEEKPDRIVSLSPALTELVGELEGMDRLVGVSDYCNYPADVEALEGCGTVDRLNFQAIEKLAPQLLLSSVPLSQEDTVRLQQMRVEVAVFPRVGDLEGLKKRYSGLATLLEGMEAGAEMGERVFSPLEQTYRDLEATAKAVEEPLSGIWLRAVPLVMATGDTFEGKLLEEVLGVSNDGGEFTGWEYPGDKAVDLYPDLIFYDQSIDPAYFAGTQVYNTTDAYKNNRMYPFDSLAFERQSGRMFRLLEDMFSQAYPDLQVRSVAMDPDLEEPEADDPEEE